MSFYLRYFTILLFLLSGFYSYGVSNILVLNSYHPQYKWTERLNDGIRDTFKGVVPPEKIHVEYMDGRVFSEDVAYLEKLRNLLAYKYKNVELDLIISTDDYAFNFLLDVHSEIFPNTPVVFGGVNFFKKDMLKGRPFFTGVLEGTSIEENIRLIQKLHPNTNEIVLLSDDTKLGRALTEDARKFIKSHKLDSLVKVYDKFTFESLNQKVAEKNKDAVFLLLAIHADRDGVYFSYDEHFIKLAKTAVAPIYSMWGVLMGSGTIGGYMNNPYAHGKEITEIGISILNGINANMIPVKNRTSYTPHFDYNVLKKFNISSDVLPDNAKVHNRPISYYQENKRLINIASFVFVVLVTFIIFLKVLVDQRTREANLNASNLEKLKNRMRDFVGIVAHDLRAPVGNILSFSQALEEISEDHKEIVPYILKSAEKSIHLINNILDISAIEAGKVKMNKEEADLHEIILDIIHEVTFLTKGKNLSLSTNLNSKLMVLIDKQRITQILQNLLTNSIKFTGQNGRVEIVVKVDGDTVNVSVKDTGVGIPKDIIGNIFDTSKHTSRVGTEGESGTGYGLPLVYNLVREHGGALTVESDENIGSNFTFTLNKVN